MTHEGLPRPRTDVIPATAFASYAHANHLYWSIVVIDVVKASDKVVRHLSMGRPQSQHTIVTLDELMQLMLSEEVFDEIICHIRHDGTLLHEAGAERIAVKTGC